MSRSSLQQISHVSYEFVDNKGILMINKHQFKRKFRCKSACNMRSKSSKENDALCYILVKF